MSRSRTAQPSVSSPEAAGAAGFAGGGAAADPASRAWANAISWPAAAQPVPVASDAVTVSQRSSSGADVVASISAAGSRRW